MSACGRRLGSSLTPTNPHDSGILETTRNDCRSWAKKWNPQLRSEHSQPRCAEQVASSCESHQRCLISSVFSRNARPGQARRNHYAAVVLPVSANGRLGVPEIEIANLAAKAEVTETLLEEIGR